MPFRSAGKIEVAIANPAPAKPAGTVAGDFLLAVGQDDSAGTVTLPAGFTALTGSPATQLSPDGATLAVGWKIAGGSEPATYAFSTSNPSIAAVLAFSGIDNTTPIHRQATVKTSTASNASPITMAPNAYAATTLICDLVTIAGIDSTTSRDWTIGAPGSATVRWDNTTADFHEVGVCSQDSVATGATTGGSPTATSAGGAAGYSIFNIALANVSAGGNVTVTPGVGSAVYAGIAPTAVPTQNVTVVTGLGSAVYTGLAPVAFAGDNKVAAPGTGQATFAGLAPTAQSSVNVVVAPGVGQGVYAGLAPSVVSTNNQIVQPGTGQAVYAGLAPTAQAGGSVAVAPGTGNAIYTGLAPTAIPTQNVTVQPGVGQAVWNGLAPNASNGTSKKVPIVASGLPIFNIVDVQ